MGNITLQKINLARIEFLKLVKEINNPKGFLTKKELIDFIPDFKCFSLTQVSKALYDMNYLVLAIKKHTYIVSTKLLNSEKSGYEHVFIDEMIESYFEWEKEINKTVYTLKQAIRFRIENRTIEKYIYYLDNQLNELLKYEDVIDLLVEELEKKYNKKEIQTILKFIKTEKIFSINIDVFADRVESNGKPIIIKKPDSRHNEFHTVFGRVFTREKGKNPYEI